MSVNVSAAAQQALDEAHHLAIMIRYAEDKKPIVRAWAISLCLFLES